MDNFLTRITKHVSCNKADNVHVNPIVECSNSIASDIADDEIFKLACSKSKLDDNDDYRLDLNALLSDDDSSTDDDTLPSVPSVITFNTDPDVAASTSNNPNPTTAAARGGGAAIAVTPSKDETISVSTASSTASETFTTSSDSSGGSSCSSSYDYRKQSSKMTTSYYYAPGSSIGHSTTTGFKSESTVNVFHEIQRQHRNQSYVPARTRTGITSNTGDISLNMLVKQQRSRSKTYKDLSGPVSPITSKNKVSLMLNEVHELAKQGHNCMLQTDNILPEGVSKDDIYVHLDIDEECSRQAPKQQRELEMAIIKALGDDLRTIYKAPSMESAQLVLCIVIVVLSDGSIIRKKERPEEYYYDGIRGIAELGLTWQLYDADTLKVYGGGLISHREEFNLLFGAGVINLFRKNQLRGKQCLINKISERVASRIMSKIAHNAASASANSDGVGVEVSATLYGGRGGGGAATTITDASTNYCNNELLVEV